MLLEYLRRGDDKRALNVAAAMVPVAGEAGILNGHNADDLLAAAREIVELEERGELITVCAADVEQRPIAWLWPQRIALGKVTLVAGDPGLGKTQLTMSIAAIVTSGGRWPVCGTAATAGDVLLLSAEDDPEDTLAPRASAAGAHLSRLHIVQAVIDVDRDGRKRRRAPNLTDDLDRIERRLRAMQDPRVVIIDPVSAYLGRADSHNNAEVRALLAPVAELAARHRIAVICVSHLNKSSGPKAMQRVVGSIAFTAAARAAYLVAREGEDIARRVMVPLKNNLGVDRGGYAFEIEPVDLGGGIHTSRVRWADSAVDVTADELLAAESKPATGSALAEASKWLVQALEHGEVEQRQLRQQVAHDGLAWHTVERAAKELTITKRKERGKGGRWLWSLSAQPSLK